MNGYMIAMTIIKINDQKMQVIETWQKKAESQKFERWVDLMKKQAKLQKKIAKTWKPFIMNNRLLHWFNPNTSSVGNATSFAGDERWTLDQTTVGSGKSGDPT
jgi:hypothetical protein